MKKCCYCESGRGHLIMIQNHYWHNECLMSRSRYFDYLQGNFNLEIPEKKISQVERHKQIYQYIKDFINQHGQSPTVCEAAPTASDNLIRNLGYERHTIKKTINALVEKGYLDKEKRSITLGS